MARKKEEVKAEEATDIVEWKTKVTKLIARVSSYMAISTLLVNTVYQMWVNATSICLPEVSESSILGILSFIGMILQLGYFEAKYRKSNGNKGWLF